MPVKLKETDTRRRRRARLAYSGSGAELHHYPYSEQLDSGVHSRVYTAFVSFHPMSQGIQIGKVAEQTGLSIDTIRFYQKIGLVKQPARSEGGFRLFTDIEIRDLVFIQKAQELGFSLTEIKQLSILNQEHGHACSQVRNLLAGRLRDVRGKISELLHLEKGLKSALRKCNRDLHSNQGSSHDECCPVLKALEQEGANGS